MYGTRIALERERLGLTQTELAEKVDVSQKSISKYERGDRRPNFETISKMAALFGVTTDYLLGISPKEPSAAGSDYKYSDCLKRIVSNCLKLNETGQNYIEAQTEFALQQDKYLKDVDIKKES